MQVRRRSGNGEPTRAVLPLTCQTVGAALARKRNHLEWSPEEVAARLLLSKRQVLGLEQADPGAFYTIPFFVKALRRYMDLTGLPSDLLDVPDADRPPELRLTLAEERLRPPRRRLSLATVTGVALLVLTVGAGATTWWRPTLLGRSSDAVPIGPAAPLPSRPVELLPITPPPVTARPAAVDRAPREEWRAELTPLAVASR
jgi:hypothetical protein